jgi:phenylacetic acid degradation operon negative regulatory protein
MRSSSSPNNLPAQKPKRPSVAKAVERLCALQPQEVVLGIFGEYVETDDHIWSGGLVTLLGDLNFSAAASRIALNRVVLRGLLEPSRDGRFIFYKITPRLAAVHAEGRRQTFSRAVDPDWDGEWTMVWYSMPDAQRLERVRLGRWLNFRGFGALQDGTWIAPGKSNDDIMSLLRRLSLENSVVVFNARINDPTQLRGIIDKAWDLKLLSRMYESFIKKFAALHSPSAISALSPQQAFVIRTTLIEMFRKMASFDPNLPDAILNISWKRREAIALFQELQLPLREKALAYFRNSTLKLA